MWLYGEFGFVSWVQHGEDSDGIVVRARVADDLDRLRDRFMPELTATVATPERDYQYRGFIGRTDFAAGLSRLAVDGLGYGNFKNNTRETLGQHRAGVHAAIWVATRDLARPPVYRKPASKSLEEIEDTFERAWAADAEAIARMPERYEAGDGVESPVLSRAPDDKQRK